jgi:gamma-glutamyltranspeptidase/glutathione hydrolase
MNRIPRRHIRRPNKRSLPPYGRILSLLLVALMAGWVGCAGEPSANTQAAALPAVPDGVASGQLGMVSSAHPIATRAGLEIRAAGGNAFDAAIAVAATLNVVEPMNSGVGGYGTILIYDVEEGRGRFLNASDRIPRAVNSDLFRPPTPGYRENRRGAKAVSTPGNLRAWQAMSEEYGTKSWEELFAPAIRAASDGFEIDARTAGLIASAFDEFAPHSQAIYGQEGRPLGEGERLVQEDLARSLAQIAQDGPGAMYGGSLGEAVAAAMEQAGGFLALEDLLLSEADWWEPIQIDYRGVQVMTASPPSTAFPSLIRLGLMSQFDAAELGHNTVPYLHNFAEVTKQAFWSRLAYAGDPGFRPPPLDLLLSEAFWEEVVAHINPDEATPFEYPQVVVEGSDATSAQGETSEYRKMPPPGPEHAMQHTTHFVVADQWGNVVSATQTLGNTFGSRIMPEGTGIWLNNSLAYCTFEPKGNPMDAHAGRRKLSGDCPTFILRDGKPWVAIGTPGGHTIGQTVPQMVMNIIDFDMNVQDAISAPRVSFVEPDRLAVEREISAEIRDALAAMGHKVFETGGLGNAHGLTIEYGPDGKPIRFLGGSDPRGSGLAKGY